MSNTFQTGQYCVTTSLNERSIYIRIVNTVSYMCYEGNFDSTAFKLPFELANIMELIDKSFEEEDAAYKVKIELDNGVLKLAFQCTVGGFLKVAFDLRLREKLMSNDAQLTVNFQRVEQKQLETFELLTRHQSAFDSILKRMSGMEKMLEALGHADICFVKPPNNSISDVISFPIDSKKIEINANNNSVTAESFKKIKYFYQLEELTMSICKWNSPSLYASNSTVKNLILVDGTFGDISFIKNFPSLEELNMRSISMDSSIVSTLRAIKHKIQTLTFTSCAGINQTEMQTYCTQQNIKLNLTY